MTTTSAPPSAPDDEARLAALDALLLAGGESRWQDFYRDRQCARPFFVDKPDECLAGWCAEGRLPRGRALDLGCGNGRNALFLAREGFEVEAIDLSGSAIAWAREQVASSGLRVDLRQESVFEAGIPPGRFDLIHDSGCFHHVAPHRRERYVDLVADGLAPGGAFVLVCFTPEGGSGLSDEAVYQRRSLGGGLGYTEARLREVWGRRLRVEVMRPMRAQRADSPLFGLDVLWAMLARKDARPAAVATMPA